MAKQLPLADSSRILPTELHEEMQRSYLEYAMSVIVGRALPDVRDGLKPVHRRILYAMYELGLTPDRPFRKCARVVGDVLGKYHPHGDQAVYDALVRMVQDFSSRYPLLAGHGNFGSVDNDPAAAMRYTETRLAPLAMTAVLQEIDEAIIDFSPNFDSSQQEPTVLPAQLPILLLNGCSGIAVGMATNIPPHNLGEVVDGLVALIDNPNLSDEALWQLIPGPDFPTGGEILDSEGIQMAYQTGRGLIPVRGVSHLETIRGEKRRSHTRTAIVVTELPYQVNKAGWIEKVASLVNQQKLEGIADLRDESDRTGMRVVIELKRDADPQAILTSLYRTTALQSNFGVIFLALVNNRPVQLSLRQILQEFLHFREETLIRQYRHELSQAQQRLEVLSGLRTALGHLDQVMEILRSAPDGPTAKAQFQVHLDLTPAQADAILAMPLRRITGLEQHKLEQEYTELAHRVQQLETLLDNRRERLKGLKKELRQLKKQFSDPRRTRILQPMPPLPVVLPTSEPELESAPSHQVPTAPVATSPASTERAQPSTANLPERTSPAPQQGSLALYTPQAPPETAILQITRTGEASWSLPEQAASRPEVVFQAPIQGQTHLWVFSQLGKVYPLALAEIPPAASLAPMALMSLLAKGAQSEAWVTQIFPSAPDQDLLLLTRQGRLKRLATTELVDLGARGLSLLKLKEEDHLQWGLSLPSETSPQQNLLLATSSGRLLRVPLTLDLIPRLGRVAQGQTALRLRPQEALIGALVVDPTAQVGLLTQQGYGKALAVTTVRLAKLEDLGTTVIQFLTPTDRLLACWLWGPGQGLALRTSLGRDFLLSAAQFTVWGKDGPGDRLVSLEATEQLLWANPVGR
jgi:DNA gyrase subunit A